MKFTKLHGLGNDYVLVNAADEERIDDPSARARAVSDRHTGIGSDGLILIYPSTTADVRMEMYNADGSRAQMCGNGLRCVAKYAIERGLRRPAKVPSGTPLSSPLAKGGKRGVGRCPRTESSRVPGPTVRVETGSSVGRVPPAATHTEGGSNPGCLTVRVETDSGVKICECHIVDGKVRSVRVDMGEPSLAACSLPSTITLDRIINRCLQIGGRDYVITCVSMGNPHAVVFVDDLDTIELPVLGPQFEHAAEFPERINAHFARVDSPDHVTMKTWERGSGITQACGSGACAVCVAGAVTERTRRSIIATLPGGDLEIEWADDDHVYMTGPAVEVFTGDWP